MEVWAEPHLLESEVTFDLDHFTITIVTARAANAVGQFGFAAIRAEGGARTIESVVRSALVTTGFRVTSFWISHDLLSPCR